MSESMCPHCGLLLGPGDDTLTPYHDWPIPPVRGRSVCPGSKQNPRNALSDRRPLWNGKPNPHMENG